MKKSRWVYIVKMKQSVDYQAEWYDMSVQSSMKSSMDHVEKLVADQAAKGMKVESTTYPKWQMSGDTVYDVSLFPVTETTVPHHVSIQIRKYTV